ncbi:receptor-type tyrosine-protein phosphatase alpha-like isoform X1 [Haliotis rufescens]|uniref:receptor-type tyrosine-protein phosphatase alpha-like isoform X1 n=1 Tax=Haliotis rufescens TaxID=6454 RepID=UPI00201F0CAF|nr:receptor-type tyrosine-protein phosphatase alpha-like isoform X1 [Haliotis rufescens]
MKHRFVVFMSISMCTTECDTGNYGINCNKACAERKCVAGTTPCDRHTGSCVAGCLPGWRDSDCTRECSQDTYGDACANKCQERNCQGTSQCHHVTGKCEPGCKAGWTGEDCSRECDGGNYGVDCKKTCIGRKCAGTNSSCDRYNGSCDGGCLVGWTGDDCTQAASTSVAVIPLAAGLVAIVPIAMLIVLIIVRIRKSRKRTAEESAQQTVHNSEVRPSSGADLHYSQLCQPEFKHESTQESVYERLGDEGEHGSVPGLTYVNLEGVNHKSGGRTITETSVYETISKEEGNTDPIHGLLRESGHPYENYPTRHSPCIGRMIQVSDLEDFVRQLEEHPREAEEEFKNLPDGFMHCYNDSQLPQNKGKNRFKSYYPYDYNRVVLNDGQTSNYINASYMDGYKTERKYIAAQGPYKPDVVEDFWRMIWQEGCTTIVMVTGLEEGGKMNCLRYWPEKDQVSYGDITVTMETETCLANYTLAMLTVQHKKKTTKRHVRHFHFTTWLDRSVPDMYAFLEFRWKIKELAGKQKHPITVHCSAGIGQTGTYIAIDSLVEQATTEGVVDVVSFVSNSRSQRKGMIQSKDQYLFVYQAVARAAADGDMTLDSRTLKGVDLGPLANLTMGNKTVQQHLEVLQCTPAQNTEIDIIVSMPSHVSTNGFYVLTSLPDKEEVWNQIYKTRSRSLVTWAQDNQTYLPSTESSVTTSRLTASMRSRTIIMDDVNVDTIDLVSKEDNATFTVQHHHLTGSVRDHSGMALIDSLLALHRHPCTIVSRSMTETRLLVLLLNIASRIQDDGKVDIITNMRRLYTRLGGRPFTLTDVCFCLEFSKQRLGSL